MTNAERGEKKRRERANAAAAAAAASSDGDVLADVGAWLEQAGEDVDAWLEQAGSDVDAAVEDIGAAAAAVGQDVGTFLASPEGVALLDTLQAVGVGVATGMGYGTVAQAASIALDGIQGIAADEAEVTPDEYLDGLDPEYRSALLGLDAEIQRVGWSAAFAAYGMADWWPQALLDLEACELPSLALPGSPFPIPAPLEAPVVAEADPMGGLLASLPDVGALGGDGGDAASLESLLAQLPPELAGQVSAALGVVGGADAAPV